jgi:molecular chaperone DnaK
MRNFMDNLFAKFLSFDKKKNSLEKKLNHAENINNIPQVIRLFSKLFLLLLNNKKEYELSDLITNHTIKSDQRKEYEDIIGRDQIKKAIDVISVKKRYRPLEVLCRTFNFYDEYIDLLAAQGKYNEILSVLTRNDGINKERLLNVVICWEKHNGSIKNSPAFLSIFQKIFISNPEYIPDLPQIYEIAGKYKQASELYIKSGHIKEAAYCLELNENHEEALKYYEKISDKSGILRMAEKIGDYKKALAFSSSPNQKIRLLSKLERFSEAINIAITLDNSANEINSIKSQALILLEKKIQQKDFLIAIDLCNIANVDEKKKQNIIDSAHSHYDNLISQSDNKQQLENTVREKIKFEEKIKNYLEAATLAEDILKDYDLASLLFEKANLFNKAIETVNEQYFKEKDNINAKIRLANLNEKGGNLLKAAKLYEQVGEFEKASILYENLNNYSKAIECYLKKPDVSTDRLVKLYLLSGEPEKAIELHIKKGSLLELERALTLANTYRIQRYIKFLDEEIARHLKGNEKDLDRLYKKAVNEIQNTYSQIVGIDFGTTNSVVAIFNKLSKKIEIVTSSDGTDYEPSYFGFGKNNHPIYGFSARRRSLTEPHDVIACIKRELGKGKLISIGGREYRAEEIAAKILQKLKSNAEEYLNHKVKDLLSDFISKNNLTFPESMIKDFIKKQEQCINLENVVLTVPAYFNDIQKRATKDAAEIAGLSVKRLLHEPTAAALSYGYHKSYKGDIVIVDLGGGTLDISILSVGDGLYAVEEIGGDTKLGGRDIDELLLKVLIEDIEKQTGIKINENTHWREIARLIAASEELKIMLSDTNNFTLEIPHFMGKTYSFSYSRSELEKISEPILNRFTEKLRDTLKSKNQVIQNFILVGNATKMPIISAIAENEIKATRLKIIDAGTVVSSGAAILGGILSGDISDSLLLDIVPYSLGISIKGKDTDNLIMSTLISKNTLIPTTNSQDYTTTRDNQNEVKIDIYQGESNVPGNNYFLGSFILDKIFPAKAGKPEIDVSFDIDSNCILTVSAKDKFTGNKRSIRIEGAVSLSYAEKEKLTKYFTDNLNAIKQDYIITDLVENIEKQKLYCEGETKKIENLIKSFLDLFHEKIELNPRLYKANSEQVGNIQIMFVKKEELFYGIPSIKDKLHLINNSYNDLINSKFNYEQKDSFDRIKERVEQYKIILNDYSKLKDKLINNFISPLSEWINVLQSIEPDLEKMKPIDQANYFFVTGKYEDVRNFLEARLNETDEFSNAELDLLLKSYVNLGLRKEYFKITRKYGLLFGLSFPDFNRLNTYLKSVEDRVFLIHTTNSKGENFTGSGFIVSGNIIATNRHVVDDCTIQNIRIISKDRIYYPVIVDVDPSNDIAVLKMEGNLNSFKVGEFNFIEPGEEVIAIGFPSPDTLNHKENIYISKGIVNSIRVSEYSTERVIFIDAKIGCGMSGGPLINELGEVVGILTMIRYRLGKSEQGLFATENQPVALPISLFKKYIQKYKNS